MGVSETLGVIFGVLLLFAGIGVAIWFFFVRDDSTGNVGAACDGNDSSCAQGQICENGRCQYKTCTKESDCDDVPGSSCYGIIGQTQCLPRACRTTSDCCPASVDSAKMCGAVCVPNDKAETVESLTYQPANICVPLKPPSGGGKYEGILQTSNGDNTHCNGSEDCSAGTYCYKDNGGVGRCIRCGYDKNVLCETQDMPGTPGLLDFCNSNGSSCAGGSGTCVTHFGGERIKLPWENEALEDDLGICLPTSSSSSSSQPSASGDSCIFSLYNAEKTTPKDSNGDDQNINRVPGQCPRVAPFCVAKDSKFQCQGDALGALCGYAGLPTGASNNGLYDVTNLCLGQYVPNSALPDWNPSSQGASQSMGTECTFNGGSTPQSGVCPIGTQCIANSTQSNTNGQNQRPTSQYEGLCQLYLPGSGEIRENGVAPAISGAAQAFTYNCSSNFMQEGITSSGVYPVCRPTDVNNSPPLNALGIPGEFCYDDFNCIYPVGQGGAVTASTCQKLGDDQIGGICLPQSSP